MKYHPPGPSAAASWPGLRFGRWTAIKALGYRADQPNSLWARCRCDCGRVCDLITGNLRSGMSTQCTDCGWKATHAAVVDRAKGIAAAKGRVWIAPRTLACVDCGEPCRIVSDRCRECAEAARVGVPWKHPESLSVVAARVGVTKQRVQQVVAARGWDGMLDYFSDRIAATGGAA